MAPSASSAGTVLVVTVDGIAERSAPAIELDGPESSSSITRAAARSIDGSLAM